ncbi:MAG: aminotransferase class III-fold pyridoxal phosphate-dependent enzyme [Actinobacteria bacterium]|nr:aminotransferase class III-fold pyridoxal phosphate-dependent enzyme [Actinomycetota bacterium]
MYSEGKSALVEQKRKVVTAIPGPKSAELIKRRADVVSASLGMAFPVFIERSQGGIIVDVDGNHIIDLGAGIAVVSVGNANPKVVENVKNAIARSYTKRPAIVVFEHGYHGRTNLTLAMTAKNMPYKDSFGPFAPEIYRMPMAYPYRWNGDQSNCAAEALEIVTHKIEKEIGAKNVAAIVIEPIQGEGGFVVPPKGFLPGLAKFAKENQILFIADEVQTGFARTGKMFASEDENLEPDLICTAKGIAAGLPLSGVTGRAEIMDSIHVSGLGGTYGGNPLACAAALGAIETIEKENLVARANKLGTIIESALTEMKRKYSIVGDVRGRGAMQAIELVKPGTTEPNPDAVTTAVKYAQQKGVLILTAGTYGNVIRLLPPLIIGEDLLKEGLAILDEALASIK